MDLLEEELRRFRLMQEARDARADAEGYRGFISGNYPEAVEGTLRTAYGAWAGFLHSAAGTVLAPFDQAGSDAAFAAGDIYRDTLREDTNPVERGIGIAVESGLNIATTRRLPFVGARPTVGFPAVYAAQQYAEAGAEARQAGLPPEQQAAYAATQGAWEAVPTAVMGAVGLGGLEGPVKGAVRGIGANLFRGGKTYLSELAEEIPTMLGQGIAADRFGVRPGAATPENLWEAATETALSTGFLVGGQQAVSTIGDRTRFSTLPVEQKAAELLQTHPESVDALLERTPGTPSRTDWDAAGIPYRVTAAERKAMADLWRADRYVPPDLAPEDFAEPPVAPDVAPSDPTATDPIVPPPDPTAADPIVPPEPAAQAPVTAPPQPTAAPTVEAGPPVPPAEPFQLDRTPVPPPAAPPTFEDQAGAQQRLIRGTNDLPGQQMMFGEVTSSPETVAREQALAAPPAPPVPQQVAPPAAPQPDPAAAVRDFAQRLATGQVQGTPEDVQFFTNNAKAIEAELARLREATPPTEAPIPVKGRRLRKPAPGTDPMVPVPSPVKPGPRPTVPREFAHLTKKGQGHRLAAAVAEASKRSGHRPEDLYAEIEREHAVSQADWQRTAEARRTALAKLGMNEGWLRKRLREAGDYAGIARFDDVAASMAQEYPEVMGSVAEMGTASDASEALWAFLKRPHQDRPQPWSTAIVEKAVRALDRRPPAEPPSPSGQVEPGDAAEPDDWDTREEFYGDVPFAMGPEDAPKVRRPAPAVGPTKTAPEGEEPPDPDEFHRRQMDYAQEPRRDVKAPGDRAIYEAMRSVPKAFGTDMAMRFFRPNSARAAGQWDPESWAIRVRKYGDWRTAAHEVGHAIHDLLYGDPFHKKLWQTRLDDGDAAAHELAKLGEAAYRKWLKIPAGEKIAEPFNGWPNEGFAEFVSLWMTNRAAARRDAPSFVDEFEGHIAAAAEGRETLDRVHELVRAQADAGAVARGRQVENRDTQIQRKYRGVRDWLGRVFSAKPWAEEASALQKPAPQTYALYKTRRGTAQAIANNFLQHGVYDLGAAGDLESTLGPGVDEAFVGMDEDFTTYAIADYTRRVTDRDAELVAEGKLDRVRDTAMVREDAETIDRTLKTPEREEALHKLYLFHDALLESLSRLGDPHIVMQTALMRAAAPKVYIPTAPESRYPDKMVPAYLPQHRVPIEDQAVGGGGGGKGTTSLGRRRRGGRLELVNLREQIASEAARKIESAFARMVETSLWNEMQASDGNGLWFDKVPPATVPVELTTIGGLERIVRQALKKAGAQVDGQPLDVTIDFANLEGTRPSKDKEPGGLSEKDAIDALPLLTYNVRFRTPAGVPMLSRVNDEGKIEWALVDEEFYEFFRRDPVATHDAMVPLEKLGLWIGTQTKRSVLGLNPGYGFGVAPSRGLLTLSMQSHSTASVPRIVATYAVEWGKALAGSVSPQQFKADSVKLAERLGLDKSVLLQPESDPLARAARNFGRSRTNRVLDWRNWFDKTFEINSAAGRAVKQTELVLLARDKQKALKDLSPADLEEMLLKAKEVDYDDTARGEWQRGINLLTLFGKAAIQGNRAVYRTLRDPQRRVRFLRRATTLVGAALAYWMFHKDEEWWTRLTPEEKIRHLHVRVFGETVRWSVPEELMPLTTYPLAMVDAMYQRWKGKGDKQAKDTTTAFVNIQVPGANPAIALSVQLMRNKDWMGRTIYDEGKKWFAQHDERTSNAAKAVGPAIGVSPQKLDHAVATLFGANGREAVRFLSGTEDTWQSRPEHFTRMPVVRRAFVPGGEFPDYSYPVQNLYDAAAEANLRGDVPETADEKRRRLLMDDAKEAMGHLRAMRKMAAVNSEDDAREWNRRIIAVAEEALRPDADRAEMAAVEAVAEAQRRMVEIETLPPGPQRDEAIKRLKNLVAYTERRNTSPVRKLGESSEDWSDRLEADRIQTVKQKALRPELPAARERLRGASLRR